MKRHKQFSYLQKAIIVVFILILILNILAPYTADDFSFMEHSGYLDLWKREFNYWFTWSGRSVAGILVRHMVVLPKPVYDVIASGIYVLYLYLICRLAAPEVRASDFLIAAGLHFLFMPVFGQTVLWVSGACNYLFTAVLILLFLLFPLFLPLQLLQHLPLRFPQSLPLFPLLLLLPPQLLLPQIRLLQIQFLPSPLLK